MSITINGSGTVTGISAGGLPDGCITTAELGSSEQSGLCKAWVNFNGTGTVAIRTSYNVSSITDNGVGDYTVNFASGLVDGNYVAAMQMSGAVSGTTWFLTPGLVTVPGSSTPVLKSSSAVRFALFNDNAANTGHYDANDCGVAIFR